jgi:hypothetical protein
MDRYTKLVSSHVRVVLTGLAVLSATIGHYRAATRQQAQPPEKVPSLSVLAEFTPVEIQTLKTGQPVSKLLQSDPDHEVAVAGAVWIDAPVEAFVAAMKDIEHLEHGRGFLITKRISNPPRPEDFAALELTDFDIEQLKKCRVGDCGIKLDKPSIERIQKQIDWSKPTAKEDVNALMRQMALEFTTAYHKEGNKALVVYANKKEPVDIDKEFDTIVGEMQPLWRVEPELRRYLLEYPQANLPNSTSFLYWQMVNFGIRPVLRINHLAMTENAGHTIVASKLLYADHYFWTALEIRELVPGPGPQGFWFVDVSRGRSGSLAKSGPKGHVIRDEVRKHSLKGLNEALIGTKAFLEAQTRR